MKIWTAQKARSISGKNYEKFLEIMKQIKEQSKKGWCTLNVIECIAPIRKVLEALGYTVEYICPPKYKSSYGDENSCHYDYKLQNDYYKISW